MGSIYDEMIKEPDYRGRIEPLMRSFEPVIAEIRARFCRPESHYKWYKVACKPISF